MTQSAVIIDPNTVDGSGLATILNNFRSSLLSGHSGSSAPSYATAGTFYWNTAATPWQYKLFDGTDWVTVLDFHPTTNVLRLYNSGALLGALATLNSVGTSQITDASITAVKLASDAVETAKIKNNAVTAAKLSSSDIPAILSLLLGGNTLNHVLKGTGTGHSFGLPPVAASSSDPAPAYLDTKLAVGSLLSLSIVTGGGGSKQAKISLANGTAGKVIGYDGSGNPAALTAGYEPLVVKTVSGDAVVDFTGYVTSAYDRYRIEYSGVRGSSDQVGMILRGSVSGSGFLAGTNYDRFINSYRAGVDTPDQIHGQGVDGILVHSDHANYGVGSASTAGLSGVINIGDINSASAYKSVHGQGGGRGANTNHILSSFSGTIRTSSVLNDLRLLLTSGNITGKFSLYGVK